MVFLHKEGSRGRPCGSRFVCVIMCVRPTLGYRRGLSINYHLVKQQMVVRKWQCADGSVRMVARMVAQMVVRRC